MFESMQLFFYKMRGVIFGIFILLVISFVALMIPATTDASTGYADGTGDAYDSPNAVTNGLSAAFDEMSACLDGAGRSLSTSLSSISSAVSDSGKVISTGAATVGHGLTQGTAYMGRGVHGAVASTGRGLQTSALFLAKTGSSSITFVVEIPLTMMSFATNNPVMSAITQPADKIQVPVIDAAAPVNFAAYTPNSAQSQAVAPGAVPTAMTTTTTAAPPVWPLHGAITTMFGASDWPYQTHHTGLDISDGAPSGVSPIHAFKPGQVTLVEYSSIGLGNHVVVDHGNGITSVYGHMYAMNVQVGQHVDQNSILGYEGTTGASTGPHLHFEIRINGQPQDPLKFIVGRP
jgi:hypothetical protein